MNTLDRILEQNNLTLDSDVSQTLAKQILGESILAILASNTKHLEATTYDYQLVEATKTTIVNELRNHWNL
jgi:hypothetical protein